jgi:large subunit ribosomal protein L25
MEIRELTVERRESRGKGAAKRLRREGRVPAILYGAVAEPLALSVTPRRSSAPCTPAPAASW